MHAPAACRAGAAPAPTKPPTLTMCLSVDMMRRLSSELPPLACGRSTGKGSSKGMSQSMQLPAV